VSQAAGVPSDEVGDGQLLDADLPAAIGPGCETNMGCPQRRAGIMLAAEVPAARGHWKASPGTYLT
jgi:hypothetical protein